MAEVDRMAEQQGVSATTLFRDLVIFQVKLALDGLKDVVLAPLSIGVAIWELFLGGRARGRLFYSVLRLGERYDLWLNLFGAAERVDRDGLFGASRAGSDTLLGRLEQQFRGGDEPRRRRGRGSDAASGVDQRPTAGESSDPGTT